MVSTPFTPSPKAPSRAMSSAIVVSYSGERFVDDVGRCVSSCAGDKEGPLGEGKVFGISRSHSETTAVRIDCIYKGFSKMRSMEYQNSATRLLLQLLFCLNTFQRRVEVGIVCRFCGARTSIWVRLWICAKDLRQRHFRPWVSNRIYSKQGKDGLKYWLRPCQTPIHLHPRRSRFFTGSAASKAWM